LKIDGKDLEKEIYKYDLRKKKNSYKFKIAA
jgi:hypothetical protein